MRCALPHEGVAVTVAIVVFGFGNPGRGDDGLGPAIIERLDDHLVRTARTAEVETIVDFQPQIEHAADLRGRALAVFVDAGTGTPEPFTLARLAPSARFTHSSHALDPAALLHVYREAFGAPPPPAYLLCVRGYGFELGEPIGDGARANLATAWDALCTLLDRHRPTRRSPLTVP